MPDTLPEDIIERCNAILAMADTAADNAEGAINSMRLVLEQIRDDLTSGQTTAAHKKVVDLIAIILGPHQ